MARLTPDALVYDLVSAADPQVSPDGTRVVYALGRADREHDRGWLNDVREQVFVVDFASGERRMLTREPDDLTYPQWSPDGGKLVARIATDNGVHARLLLIDINTGHIRRVGPAEGTVGVWS